jgi:hypothetical protein
LKIAARRGFVKGGPALISPVRFRIVPGEAA